MGLGCPRGVYGTFGPLAPRRRTPRWAATVGLSSPNPTEGTRR